MSQTNLPEWDLSDLFPGLDSVEFENAQKHLQKQKTEFEKYKEQLAKEEFSAPELLVMIQDFEQMEIAMLHLYAYCHLQYDVDTTNSIVKGALDKMKTLVATVSSELEFFMQALKKMSKEKYEEMLHSTELKPYKHFLVTVKLYEPYTLAEREERLLTLKSLYAAQAWGQFHTELSATLEFGTMMIDGKEQSVTPALLKSLLSSPDREIRREAYRLGRTPFGKMGNLFAYAFNAVVADFEQESTSIRGFSSGLARAALGDEVTEEHIKNMIEVITEKIPSYQKYYGWKAKKLGIEDFSSFDVMAPLSPKRPKIHFEEGKEMVLSCFKKFDPEFHDLANKFFVHKWIDAREGKNKYAGAYCYSMEEHPYILLNYQPDFLQVFTMVHELGHGIHALLSGRNLPFLMRNTSKVVAESASQFSEILLLDYLSDTLEDQELRDDLLATHIDDLLYCLSSAITVTAFEIKAHEKVAEGGLSSEILNEIWENVHTKVNGEVIHRTTEDPGSWARIPHMFQSPFYYFTYPMSLLLVLALYEKYLEEGQAFVPKFKEFLSLGGSLSPSELMKTTLGIEFGSKKFFADAFSVVERMTAKLMN